MIAAYALPTGAIIFSRTPPPPFSRASFLADGDADSLPRRIFAEAEREGAGWYVPGAREAQGDELAFDAACSDFSRLICHQHHDTDFIDHPPAAGPSVAVPPSETGADQAGREVAT